MVSLRREDLSFFFMALAPLFSVFFIIPFELFYPQREVWDYATVLPFTIAAIGVLLYAIVVFPLLIILARMHRKAFEIFALVLCGLGVFVLMADLYAPIELAPLDGRRLVSPETWRTSARELVFAVIVFGGVPYSLSRRRLETAALYTSLSTALIAAAYSGVVLLSGPPQAQLQSHADAAAALSGNIYHIVLDEMQSDAALLYLRETRSKPRLNGFTIYPYNHSNYLYTPPSFASYITGTTYHGSQSFKEWKRYFERTGIFQDMRRAGYRVSMLSPRQEWKNPDTSTFITHSAIVSEVMGGASWQWRDFFQLWFARSAPNVLTNEALKMGGRISNNIFRLTRKRIRYPDTIVQGREPYSSVLMLRYLKQSEAARPPRGEYVYAHAILPHGPYVMNSNCEYRQDLPQRRTSSYYQQVHCAFLLTLDFLDELRNLKRYDDATIIIHADTGHGFRGFLSRKKGRVTGSVLRERKKRLPSYRNNRNGWTENQIAARSLALLMIKPARANGPLAFSELKSQLVDLRPTLQALTGYRPADESAPEGAPLITPNFPAERPHNVCYYDDMAADPEMHWVNLTDGALFRHMHHLITRH